MKIKSLIILAGAMGLLTSAQAEQVFQPHESINGVAKDFIAQHVSFEDYEINLTPLDSQLKLAVCPEPLEAFITGNPIKAGRNSIGIRCNTLNKWSIYLSVIVKIYQPVLVLTQALQRGDTITRDHLSLERRDVSALRGDFISRFEDIDNKQAVRPMLAGSLLSSRNVTEPKVVRRGDKITISSVQSDFAIRMNGLAMMDGVKGQRIRIKNQSSGRIIIATVVEAGLVSVDH
jgi:flagella basal body P-ring formation protein FlgA